MKKVRIIGAGFSGLSLAYFLQKNGCEVEIFEQSARTGGLISSPKTSFGIYETAANGFLSNQLVEDFISDLGLTPLRPGKAAKKRFIFRKFPRRWPLGFLETLSLLGRALLRALTRKLSPQTHETIRSWGHRVLGAAATHYLLEAALQGIYAGDASLMSAELIFKKSKQGSRKSLGLASFENGMGQMIEALSEHLLCSGVKIHLSQKVSAAQMGLNSDSSLMVICTNPHQAAEILTELKDPSEATTTNASLLKKIELRALTTVTAYFPRPPQKFAGFGILFPKAEGRWPLGILQNSHIFPRQASHFSETWILSGIEHSDTEINSKIFAERQIIYQEQASPSHLQITRWPTALPHYTVELKQILDQLRPMKNIWLHGNYLGGIGLSKILEQSKNLASQLAAGADQ